MLNMELSVLFLLSAFVSALDAKTLTFMFVTSFGEYGLNSSGVIPAAEMAVRDINNRSNLLPGYVLGYDSVRNSQCHYDRSLDTFFQGIQNPPVKLAIIGCGCSVATQPVAAISHHWNISQIAYFSGSAELSDRSRYKTFFRVIPSSKLESPAILSLMKHFGWKKIYSITQDEALFTVVNTNLAAVLAPLNYTLSITIFKTTGDPVKVFETKSFHSDDYRILYLNCYSPPARKIICEASKRGYTYPKYAWIIHDWYINKWWTAAVDGGNVNCTDEELERFLDKAITLLRYLSPDSYSSPTDAGITPQQFQAEYQQLALKGGYTITDAGGRLYDAIWVLAVALNHTMDMVNVGNINGTGCENTTGSLVPLDQFSYSNKKMGCLILYNIQRTNFSGVSGNIRFDANGSVIQYILRLKQYGGSGNLTKTNIAYFNILDNYTFMFESNFSDQRVYPNGIPPDGTAAQVTVTTATPLVVIVYILALCGIIFSSVCLVFNVVFRKRRVVKLSSPNLNLIIILGAVLMYISVYLQVLPISNQFGVQGSCVLREWLFVVGYSLCFGSVLAKMWRIYYIFQNPTAKKILIKDSYMIVATLIITLVGVILLLFGTAIPELMGDIIQNTHMETPTGVDSLGIRQQYYIWICYGPSTYSFYWRILIFAYLGVLQIIGIMLAFQTRKVQFPGLNDSLHIAAIIYTSSVTLVVLMVDVFVFYDYLNTFGAVFTLGVIILTTTFVAVTFIPKMYLLYKDPEGNSITSAVSPSVGNDIKHDTKMVSIEGSYHDSSLKNVIKELQQENSMLKEQLKTYSKTCDMKF